MSTAPAPIPTPPPWWLLGAATVSRALLAFLVGLLLWATVPALLGWSAHVVLSGSMEPRIAGGDVVLASDASLGEVVPGQVVVFDDPNVPGRVVVHRATAVDDPSGLTTKGDANPTADTLPVDDGHLLGIGRLRVGLVGLPSLWLHEKRWVPLGLLAGGLVLMLWLIRRDRQAELAWAEATATATAEPDVIDLTDPVDLPEGTPVAAAEAGAAAVVDVRDSEPVLDLREGERSVVLASDAAPADAVDPARARRERGGGPGLPGSGLTGGTLLLALVALATTAALVTGQARAAFAASVGNGPESWGMSSSALYGTGTYVSTVNGDGPLFFYRLNQSSGANATDSSGNGRTGGYVGAWTYQVSGQPLPRNAGLGVMSNGSTSCISSPLRLNNPTTYSYEIWFRTTTSTGGKLAAFEIEKTGESAQYDRHLYMQNDGRLTFGVWLGSAFTMTTPLPYNDGIWHQAVVTMGSAGQRIYVDGALAVSDPNTSSENFQGYWRFGCGNLSGWPTWPTDPSVSTFPGAIADVSVYSRQLSATEVADHWYAS